MQVDVSFEFAKVYNIDTIDVVKGQKFSFQVDGDGRWFSDNDDVLSLKVTGKEAEASADAEGTTTILIMDESFAIQKTLTVTHGHWFFFVYTKHFCDVITIRLKVGDNCQLKYALSRQ